MIKKLVKVVIGHYIQNHLICLKMVATLEDEEDLKEKMKNSFHPIVIE